MVIEKRVLSGMILMKSYERIILTYLYTVYVYFSPHEGIDILN